MSKKVSGWPLIAPRELPEGLPPYSNADIGKVLTVINGLEETAFIPEQTITPTSDGQGNYVADLANVTLTPADFDSSSVATLTIDDGEEPVTVEMPYDENMSLFDMPGFLHMEYGIALVYNTNKWQFVSATEAPEITISAKATAISNTPNKGWEEIRQLPEYSANDNGKVLTVQTEPVFGAVWKAVDPLPAIESGDAGKVLTVNAGETGTEWAASSSLNIAMFSVKPSSSISIAANGNAIYSQGSSSDKFEITDLSGNNIKPSFPYNKVLAVLPSYVQWPALKSNDAGYDVVPVAWNATYTSSAISTGFWFRNVSGEARSGITSQVMMKGYIFYGN